MNAENYTLQEAAEIAGFVDYQLEAGGGIRCWDTARCVGLPYSEMNVRRMAQDVIDNATYPQAAHLDRRTPRV